MRAEIFAYISFLEGPDHPEHVMQYFYLKCSGTTNMGTSQVILSQLVKIAESIRVVHKRKFVL